MANKNKSVNGFAFLLSAAGACLLLCFFSAADVALAAATPKYVVVHAWNPGADNPNYFKGCSTQWIKPMLDAIGKRGNGAVQLGISDVIYALNTDDAKIQSCLDDFFSSSEQYNVPFMLHIDTERFWDSRPGARSIVPLAVTLIVTQIRRSDEIARLLVVRGYTIGGQICPRFRRDSREIGRAHV